MFVYVLRFTYITVHTRYTVHEVALLYISLNDSDRLSYCWSVARCKFATAAAGLAYVFTDLIVIATSVRTSKRRAVITVCCLFMSRARAKFEQRSLLRCASTVQIVQLSLFDA